MSPWTEGRAANFAWASVVLLLLLIGHRASRDFGLSWDEPDNSAFGRQALQAYASLRAPDEWQSNLESKGPFYVAMAEAFSLASAVFRGPGSELEARHFAYFLSLPLAATALYSLSRRTVRPWAAFAAALLFLTQPLLFGHAFINPKDTPFMAFFLVSMAVGSWMVEARDPSQKDPSSRKGAILLPLVAGAVLGLTTAIRLFGPLAGLLVSGLAVVRLKGRAFHPLVIYWAAAGVVTFLGWPYLWGDPWGRFWERFHVMLNFPWGNLVLYRGLVYPSKELPWHYLPFITIIQLTGPVLLLALGGGVLALKASIKDRRRRALYAMFFLWVAIPYGIALLTRSEVYDNSRQFLFALPPLFLMAAVAFAGLLFMIRSTILQVGVIGLAILPGLLGAVRLHPYQYIYYNELVGGVKGAYRHYELDYWATSYRAAMEQLNRIAPLESVVEVVGPWQSASFFARPDLTVFKTGSQGSDSRPADYLMVFTRSNMDRNHGDIGPSVVRITIAGAMLAEVRAVATAPAE